MSYNTIKTQADADELADAATIILSHGFLALSSAESKAQDMEKEAQKLRDASAVLDKHGIWFADTAAKAAKEFKPKPTYANGTFAEIKPSWAFGGLTYLMRKVDGGWTYNGQSAAVTNKKHDVTDDEATVVKVIPVANPACPVHLSISTAQTVESVMKQNGNWPSATQRVTTAINRAAMGK